MLLNYKDAVPENFEIFLILKNVVENRTDKSMNHTGDKKKQFEEKGIFLKLIESFKICQKKINC